MTIVRHIFVYIVDRPEDPFLGLKNLLLQQRLAHHIISEVRLPAEGHEIVRDVEYTSRKFVRFLFYKQIFRRLDRSLQEALKQSALDEVTVVYLSDEGVWAEFLRFFRRRHSDLRFIAVNVQHGFEYLVATRYLNVRRRLNFLFQTLWGYPAFGMGSFGGSGSGVFDIYLAYDKIVCDFIYRRTHDLTFACPSTIKFGLFERYKSVRTSMIDNGQAGQEIMFALQPPAARVSSSALLKSNVRRVFQELTPLARILEEKYGKRMVLRMHPSMDRTEVMEEYRQSGIHNYADVEGHLNLADQLARCSVVMSHDSTVLWEAYVLGLVPVSVQGICFRGRLPFPHEVIDVSLDHAARLQSVLSCETAEKYSREISNDAFDWESIIMGFVGKRSAVEMALRHTGSELHSVG
jgi:hypothetical protein